MKFENIVSLFERIKSEWKEDCSVDFGFKNKQYTEDLGKLALEIPFLHNKYLNYYTDLSHLKTSIDFEMRSLLRNKREYYGGEADAKVYAEKPFGSSIKTAEKMKTYLESDEEIINLEAKLRYVEQALYYLDSVMKMISNRGFQIKSAIDWEKFINGAT